MPPITRRRLSTERQRTDFARKEWCQGNRITTALAPAGSTPPTQQASKPAFHFRERRQKKRAERISVSIQGHDQICLLIGASVCLL
jgi:hypothetical protein